MDVGLSFITFKQLNLCSLPDLLRLSVPSCGTPCTQCSSNNIPSYDMKCSKQPDLDDSGVKLLEGILSELSSLKSVLHPFSVLKHY